MSMTAPLARQRAEQAGYTHIRTFGGSVALRDWRPYGREDPRFVAFLLEGSTLHEVPASPHFRPEGTALGVWVLERS